MAQEKGKWAVTYDHQASCKVDACLTAPYWIWGPEYARIAEAVKAKTYTAGYEYFDANSKAMALMGFMEGQTPRKGVADLPEADLKLVRDTLASMLAGQFGRFRRFAGPIKDNTGKEILAAGAKLEQSTSTSSRLAPPAPMCKVCMYWWADASPSELPDPPRSQHSRTRAPRPRPSPRPRRADDRRSRSAAGDGHPRNRDSSSDSRASSPTITSTSTFAPGEVHALLGENGARKSTS